MPELPEVETVRKQLRNLVLDKKIIEVLPVYEKIVDGDINEFLQIMTNNKIIDVERYGKYLVFILNDNHVLISHLRMEGKYHIRDSKYPLSKHEHIIFYFEDNTSLRYDDTRKFGRMEIRTKDNYLKVNPLAKLGSEPSSMRDNELFLKLKNKNTTIKQALLDQTVISGLGNIYVDETLFLSKIDPRRNTKEITLDEANSLTNSAKLVLDKAIKLGGTTIKSFSATDIHGKFQNHLNVHTKVNEACPVCGNTIIKIKVGGRGTYVCETCQK